MKPSAQRGWSMVDLVRPRASRRSMKPRPLCSCENCPQDVGVSAVGPTERPKNICIKGCRNQSRPAVSAKSPERRSSSESRGDGACLEFQGRALAADLRHIVGIVQRRSGEWKKRSGTQRKETPSLGIHGRTEGCGRTSPVRTF